MANPSKEVFVTPSNWLSCRNTAIAYFCENNEENEGYSLSSNTLLVYGLKQFYV